MGGEIGIDLAGEITWFAWAFAEKHLFYNTDISQSFLELIHRQFLRQKTLVRQLKSCLWLAMVAQDMEDCI